MAIWNMFRIFRIFYDHLVLFVFIWNIFSGFGIMHQEKSGIPGSEPTSRQRQREFSVTRFGEFSQFGQFFAIWAIFRNSGMFSPFGRVFAI
jgi:hypothetical protein